MELMAIVDDISLDFPEPLESVVLRAVRRALRDFCTKSHAWRYRFVTKLEGGKNVYKIPLPKETYIMALQEAYFYPKSGGGTRLTAIDGEGIQLRSTGVPHTCFATTNEFVVVQAGGTGTLSVEFKLQAKPDVDEIPTVFADRFFDAIRAGAVWHLLRTPGQHWRPDVNMAEIDQYRLSFEGYITEARREASRDVSKPKRTTGYGGIPFGRSTGRRISY